ncbi:uncharacterized protein SCDLUD_002100 [Saccharomycodes ludwigii]|uniref:uncharacterized protein n=1 Tax=Saccharomycodes ludwigii TaxID=36035 RepID=UPI001E828C3D|nr:hypothetical protein SCDLUD_002100 [Saccharomycodes ludwigii]KAH3902282.1 hypothetical protein SCDLUD_002100 [Saccharomycodes ludwigii]
MIKVIANSVYDNNEIQQLDIVDLEASVSNKNPYYLAENAGLYTDINNSTPLLQEQGDATFLDALPTIEEGSITENEMNRLVNNDMNDNENINSNTQKFGSPSYEISKDIELVKIQNKALFDNLERMLRKVIEEELNKVKSNEGRFNDNSEQITKQDKENVENADDWVEDDINDSLINRNTIDPFELVSAQTLKTEEELEEAYGAFIPPLTAIEPETSFQDLNENSDIISDNNEIDQQQPNVEEPFDNNNDKSEQNEEQKPKMSQTEVPALQPTNTNVGPVVPSKKKEANKKNETEDLPIAESDQEPNYLTTPQTNISGNNNETNKNFNDLIRKPQWKIQKGKQVLDDDSEINRYKRVIHTDPALSRQNILISKKYNTSNSTADFYISEQDVSIGYKIRPTLMKSNVVKIIGLFVLVGLILV